MGKKSKNELLSVAEITDGDDKIDIYNPNKPSRAVVTNGEFGGSLLWYVGHHLDDEIRIECLTSLEHLGLLDAPEGISIWEGIYLYRPTKDPSIFESKPKGKFRSPTVDEWDKIHKGVPPWEEKDWIDLK